MGSTLDSVITRLEELRKQVGGQATITDVACDDGEYLLHDSMFGADNGRVVFDNTAHDISQWR
jgi:hypothetical protein